MTVQLDLPPQIEDAYLAEARARGLSLDALVCDVLVARQPPSSFTEMTPEQWVEEFRAWIRSHSGDDLPLLSDEAISREFIYDDRGIVDVGSFCDHGRSY
jgi:hypothetical protein